MYCWKKINELTFTGEEKKRTKSTCLPCYNVTDHAHLGHHGTYECDMTHFAILSKSSPFASFLSTFFIGLTTSTCAVVFLTGKFARPQTGPSYPRSQPVIFFEIFLPLETLRYSIFFLTHRINRLLLLGFVTRLTTKVLIRYPLLALLTEGFR